MEEIDGNPVLYAHHFLNVTGYGVHIFVPKLKNIDFTIVCVTSYSDTVIMSVFSPKSPVYITKGRFIRLGVKSVLFWLIWSLYVI